MQCVVGSTNMAYYISRVNPATPVFAQCKTGCSKCLSDTNCLECNAGFYMYRTSTSSIECSACPVNCITCMLASVSANEVLLYPRIKSFASFSTYSSFITTNNFQTYCSSCSLGYALSPTLQCVACSTLSAQCSACSYIQPDSKNRLTTTDAYDSNFLGQFKIDYQALQTENRVLKCIICANGYTVSTDLSTCTQCNSNCNTCTFGNNAINTYDSIDLFPRTTAEASSDATLTMRCVKCADNFMISYDLTGCQACSDHLKDCLTCSLVMNSTSTDSKILTYKSDPISDPTNNVEIAKTILAAKKQGANKVDPDTGLTTTSSFTITYDPTKWHASCSQCTSGSGVDPYQIECQSCSSTCSSCYFVLGSDKITYVERCLLCKSGSNKILSVNTYTCSNRLAGVQPTDAQCPYVMSPNVFLGSSNPNSFNCQSCPSTSQFPDINSGGCRNCDSGCLQCKQSIGNINIDTLLFNNPLALYDSTFLSNTLVPNRFTLQVCVQCQNSKYFDNSNQKCLNCPPQCALCSQIIKDNAPLIQCTQCQDLNLGTLFTSTNLGGVTRDKYFNYFYLLQYQTVSPINSFSVTKVNNAETNLNNILSSIQMKSLYDPEEVNCALCPLGCTSCISFTPTEDTTKLKFLQTYNSFCLGNCQPGFVYDKATGRCKYCMNSADATTGNTCYLKKTIQVTLDCFQAKPFYSSTTDILTVGSIETLKSELDKYFQQSPMIIFNEFGVQEIQIVVTAVKTDLCTFTAFSPDMTLDFNFPFKTRVFSSTKVGFTLKSSSSSNKLQFIGYTFLNFNGFTDVTLQDISINFDFNLLPYTPNIENYTITFNNINNVNLINIDLLGYDASSTSVIKPVYPSFPFLNARNIVMTNIFMSKFYTKDYFSNFQIYEGIFQMDSAESITINGFVVSLSKFFGLTLFKNTESSTLSFTLTNFKMNNCQWRQSSICNIYQDIAGSTQISKTINIQYFEITTNTLFGTTLLKSNFFNTSTISHVFIQNNAFSNVFAVGFQFALINTDYMILRNFSFSFNKLDQISIFKNTLEYQPDRPYYDINNFWLFQNNFTNMLRPIIFDIEDFNQFMGSQSLFKIVSVSISGNLGHNSNYLSEPFIFGIRNFGSIIIESFYYLDNQFLNLLRLSVGNLFQIKSVIIKNSLGSQFSQINTVNIENVANIEFTDLTLTSLNEKMGFVYIIFSQQDGNTVKNVFLTSITLNGLTMNSFDSQIASFFIINSVQKLNILVENLQVSNSEMIKNRDYLGLSASSILSINSQTSTISLKNSVFTHCTALGVYFKAISVLISNTTFTDFYVKFKEGGFLNPLEANSNIKLSGGAMKIEGTQNVTIMNSNFNKIIAYEAAILALSCDGGSQNPCLLNLISVGGLLLQTTSGASAFKVDFSTSGNLTINISSASFTALSTKIGPSIFSVSSNINFTFAYISNVSISNASCNAQLLIENFKPLQIFLTNTNISHVGSLEIYTVIQIPLALRKGFLFNDFTSANFTNFSISWIDSYNPLIKNNIANSLLNFVNSNISNVQMINSPIIHCNFIQIQTNNLTVLNASFSNPILNTSNQTNQFYKRRFLQTTIVTVSPYSAVWISNGSASIFNSLFQNISCSTCNGAALSIQNSNFTIVNNVFSQNTGAFGGSVLLMNNPNFGNNIASNQFFQSLATQSGGAIFLVNTSSGIVSNSFQGCMASNMGGAIYTDVPLNSNYNITISGNTFKKNTALQGATISYWGKKYEESAITPNQMSENVAINFGTGASTYPRSIAVTIFANNVLKNYNSNELTLTNVKSGGQINIQLTFKLLDENGEFMFTYTPPKGEVLRVNYTTSQVKVQGQSEWAFSNGTVQVSNLTVIGDVNKTLQLTFYSNAIYLISSDGTNFNADFIFTINIQFRDCVLGEIYLSNSRICETCGVGLYSLKLGERVCHECPSGATCPGGYMMNITAGFWRANTMTDQIAPCEADGACNGGFDTNETCSEGRIGALCGACDIDGSYWNNSYAIKQDKSCIPCSQANTNSYQVVLLMIILFVGLLKSLKAIFDGAKKQIFEKLKCHFAYYKSVLKKYGASSLTQYSDETSIYIKLLFNFFGMAAVLNEMDIKKSFPSMGTLVQTGSSISYPTFQMNNNFDCMISQHALYPPIMFFRIITIVFIGIIIIVSFSLLFSVLILLKMINKRYYGANFKSACIFMFVYLQPSMIGTIVDLITCKEVTGKSYVTADLSQICYSRVHIQFILILVFPLGLFFMVLAPVYLFYKTHKIIDEAETYENIIKYGFFIGDFRQSRFYWEFVRMYLKIFIVIVFKVLANYMKEKAILVILIILGYFLLTTFLKPYESHVHNLIDQLSCIVVSISILLALFITLNPFDGLVILGIIIMFILFLAFIGFCLYKIFYSFIEVIKFKMDLLGGVIRKIKFLRRIPYLKKFWVSYLWSNLKHKITKKIREGKRFIIGIETLRETEEQDIEIRLKSLAPRKTKTNLAEINSEDTETNELNPKIGGLSQNNFLTETKNGENAKKIMFSNSDNSKNLSVISFI